MHVVVYCDVLWNAERVKTHINSYIASQILDDFVVCVCVCVSCISCLDFDPHALEGILTKPACFYKMSSQFHPPQQLSLFAPAWVIF